jgi:hypothetical protein
LASLSIIAAAVHLLCAFVPHTQIGRFIPGTIFIVQPLAYNVYMIKGLVFPSSSSHLLIRSPVNPVSSSAFVRLQIIFLPFLGIKRKIAKRFTINKFLKQKANNKAKHSFLSSKLPDFFLTFTMNLFLRDLFNPLCKGSLWQNVAFFGLTYVYVCLALWFLEGKL